MSKSWKQIHKLENSAKHFLVRLYDSARNLGWSSEIIGQKYRDYLKDAGTDKFPRYVRSYIDGMRDIQTVLLEKELEFCYTIDGIKYSIRKESDMYYEKHGITPQVLCEKATLCGHYYISNGCVYYEDKPHR